MISSGEETNSSSFPLSSHAHSTSRREKREKLRNTKAACWGLMRKVEIFFLTLFLTVIWHRRDVALTALVV